MMQRVLAMVCVLAFGLASVAMAEAQAKPKAPEAVIEEQLRSKDSEERARGLEAVREMTAHRPQFVRMHLRGRWMQPMLDARMYDELEEIALETILDDAGAPDVAGLQEVRTRALISAGRFAEALQAAKGHYNIARLQYTQISIDLVAEALANTLISSEPRIVGRFKRQQRLGAVPGGAGQAESDLGENVLKLIKVDARPYETALSALPQRNSFQTTICRGTLLLLADRPTEAKASFELAVDLASGAQEMERAIESVAKAIRAEHGAVGPANAYILSLRGE